MGSAPPIRPIHKVLVANRGEIALRVIRTARALGLATVAVFAEPDRGAWFTAEADEKYPLGDGALADTYLNSAKIIDIARRSGAGAVHPGYGFLSENAAFARACEESGLVFIGPSSRAIALMGDKIAARQVAREAGVPVTASVEGDPRDLADRARALSGPLLVKAAAGGGGRGMRIVHDLDALPEALASAGREALNAFGDGTVYVEQYLPEARHVEVQVLADHHGCCLHLFERECSIQRRHQKIIEEAPSPTIGEPLRESICAAAVRLARKIGYTSAGTLEFLVDPAGQYFFLEMNTRIQVEHPVTELITGLDIVAEQVRIAAGRPLRLRQEDIRRSGHAIECRVYAEDPERDFQPSPGRMTLHQAPDLHGVRVEAAFRGPGEISSRYDPMIAKVAGWGETREEARLRCLQGLERYTIQGVAHNVPFLRELLRHPGFVRNELATSFCDRFGPELLGCLRRRRQECPPEAVIGAFLLGEFHGAGDGSVWQRIGYWRAQMQFGIIVDGHCRRVNIHSSSRGRVRWSLEEPEPDGSPCQPDSGSLSRSGRNRECVLLDKVGAQLEFTLDGAHYQAWVTVGADGKTLVTVYGHTFTVDRDDTLPDEIAVTGERGGGGAGEVDAPMFGRVVRIPAREGDVVTRGTALVVIEAMKMENSVLAGRDGVIAEIHVQTGQMVQARQKLVTWERDV